MIEVEIVKDALLDVEEELKTATRQYDSFNSAHEGLAVVEEEFLELRDEVFWGRKGCSNDEWLDKMETEARQLAAMAVRFMIDVRKHYED